MNKQAASRIINEKLDQAFDLIRECVDLAEQSGAVFYFPWGGEGTAMSGTGATYVPTTADHADRDYWSVGNDDGWIPSAGNC